MQRCLIVSIGPERQVAMEPTQASGVNLQLERSGGTRVGDRPPGLPEYDVGVEIGSQSGGLTEIRSGCAQCLWLHHERRPPRCRPRLDPRAPSVGCGVDADCCGV